MYVYYMGLQDTFRQPASQNHPHPFIARPPLKNYFFTICSGYE